MFDETKYQGLLKHQISFLLFQVNYENLKYVDFVSTQVRCWCKKDIFFSHTRKFHKMSPVRQNDILRTSRISNSFFKVTVFLVTQNKFLLVLQNTVLLVEQITAFSFCKVTVFLVIQNTVFLVWQNAVLLVLQITVSHFAKLQFFLFSKLKFFLVSCNLGLLVLQTTVLLI